MNKLLLIVIFFSLILYSSETERPSVFLKANMRIREEGKKNINKKISISKLKDKFFITGLKDVKVSEAIKDILLCNYKTSQFMHKENLSGFATVIINKKVFHVRIDRLHQSIGSFKVTSGREILYFGGASTRFDKNQKSRISSIAFKLGAKMVSLIFKYDDEMEDKE